MGGMKGEREEQTTNEVKQKIITCKICVQTNAHTLVLMSGVQ